MTIATKNRAAKAAPVEVKKEVKLKLIVSDGKVVKGRTYAPIGDVVPSKTNPRRVFDEAYIEELGESIRNHPLGLIQPIVVRNLGGKFEIIAGECRWRAAKKIGMKAIPYNLVDLTDEQVLEVVAAKEAGGVLLPVNDYGELKKGALRARRIRSACPRPSGMRRGAIIANGTDLGKKINICRSEKCKLHAGSSRGSGSSRIKSPEEKRKMLEQRIDAKVREECLVQIIGRDEPAGGPMRDGWLRYISDWALDRAGYDGRRLLYSALGIETKDRHDSGPLKKYISEAIDEGKGLAVLIALASANPWGNKYEHGAKLVGVNVKAMRARIAAPLRERATKKKAAAKKKARA